jgi:hypothetical protein
MTEPYDIFLSYHSTDRPAVISVAKLLKKRGLNPFLDKWNLTPGQPWMKEIEDAIHSSRAFGVFIGNKGVGPIQVAEMRAALNQTFRDKGYPVVPILLPGANPSKKTHLPAFLSQQTWIDFRPGLEKSDEFERLIALLTPKECKPVPFLNGSDISKVDKAKLLRVLVQLEAEDLVYLGEISGIRRAEITVDGVKTIAVSLVNRAEILGLLEELQANLITEYPALAQKGGLVNISL